MNASYARDLRRQATRGRHEELLEFLVQNLIPKYAREGRSSYSLAQFAEQNLPDVRAQSDFIWWAGPRLRRKGFKVSPYWLWFFDWAWVSW